MYQQLLQLVFAKTNDYNERFCFFFLSLHFALSFICNGTAVSWTNKIREFFFFLYKKTVLEEKKKSIVFEIEGCCGVIQLASQGLFWAKFPKQNRRVFLSVGEKTTKKEQQIVKLFWNENCWVLCNSFFFHKKFQRRLLILQHLQRKTFFHVSCKLLFNFPNNRYLPSKVGTVLRTVWTEAEISLQGCLERTSGRRKKKKFFFAKPWPKTLFQKNSGGRICVRTREKCSQSTETLKKWSPFVYSAQRKPAKLSQKYVFFNKN